MPRDSQFNDEQLLWRQFTKTLPQRPAACPPLLELAGWIDGRATGPDAEAAETHLAECAVCRELVRPACTERGLRLAHWLQVGGWGMAAAASIAICVVGYQVGSGRPMLDSATTDAILLSEMSFGLLDGSDEGLLPTLQELTQ
ncbi:MAG: hypothetical protein V3S08_05725 [Phycisphaerales bacterium]